MLRILTISDNLPPNNVIAHVNSTGAHRRERSSAANVSADDQRSRRGRRRGECVGVRRWGLNDFAEKRGDSGTDSKGCVAKPVNWRQAMNALEMEKWRKVRGKKKCTVARPNDRLVVGVRMVYSSNMKDGEIEKYKYQPVT